MTKTYLTLIVSLTALGGCIEVQRAMNPNGAEAVDEHTFGPVVDDEDLEAGGDSEISDQSAQDGAADDDGHTHDADEVDDGHTHDADQTPEPVDDTPEPIDDAPEPDEGDEVEDDPPPTAQGGPPELSNTLVEVTTDSGLTFIDIEEGAGEHAVNGDLIRANYTGWLEADGTKFDSSFDRNTPFTFTLGTGQVIAGWDEGFLDMHAGGKRRLIIPADLAYGDRGQPAGGIPAGATLIFDVELVALNP